MPWANSRLVLKLDVAPNRMATTSIARVLAPPCGFATISTAPQMTQVPNKIEVWRRTMLIAFRCCAGVGSAPATNQRSDGVMLR